MINSKKTAKYNLDQPSLNQPTSLGEQRKESFLKMLFAHFLPELPKSAKVLEIGPGHGDFARECQNRNLKYLGIEPSKELRLKLENAGIAVIDQTVPPISLENNMYDLVHSFDVVEHLSRYEDVMQFFLETLRVLKPGGYVSVIAPNYLTIKHLFFRYAYQHSYITTRYRLNNMLEDCGFEIVHSRCFLMWLSPKLNKLDRLLANTLIPLAINPLIESLIVMLTSEDVLFRVHKNVYDHVAVLARKPCLK